MLAFLCRYSCSKRVLKKELTLLSFLSRCLSASSAKAPKQQNDLSKYFIAEPSVSPCSSKKHFRKHLSMNLKGILVIVLFTVQICRLCTFLNPSGKPCLSFNLVLPSEIRDQAYHVAKVCVLFSYQPSPRNGKAFLLLSCLQCVNQSHPSIWAILTDLASLVLAEIQNKLLQFSTVIH